MLMVGNLVSIVTVTPSTSGMGKVEGLADGDGERLKLGVTLGNEVLVGDCVPVGVRVGVLVGVGVGV
jgi:hypothetical protein